MSQFLDERIDVEQAELSPKPIRFTLRGEVHVVGEVLSERVDIGHGSLSPRSRKWYTRRHRRYYTVQDSAGDVYEMYLDYANRKQPTWWLVRKVTSQ